MRPRRQRAGARLSLAVAAAVATAVLAALISTGGAAQAQEAPAAALRVSMAVWIAADGSAEFCIDLADADHGRTRQCPERRRLHPADAPEGRWLRTADLYIAPEAAVYVRVRRTGRLLELGLGVRSEGVARVLRARAWRFDWQDAEPNRWLRSSSLTLNLPVAPHPELWPPASGLAPAAQRLELGQRAPDFILPALNDGSALIALSAARAAPSSGPPLTLIVFWSSWAPFVDETLGLLTDLAAERDDLLVVAVNVYEVEDGAGQAFAQNYAGGANVLHLVDADAEVAQHYRIDGVPELFLLDQYGVYRTVIRGAAPRSAILAAIADVE